MSEHSEVLCGGCEGLSDRLLCLAYDDAKVWCSTCGEEVGTIEKLSELLIAALEEEESFDPQP